MSGSELGHCHQLKTNEDDVGTQVCTPSGCLPSFTVTLSILRCSVSYSISHGLPKQTNKQSEEYFEKYPSVKGYKPWKKLIMWKISGAMGTLPRTTPKLN